MKRTSILTLALILTASMAFAYGGYGMGRGMGPGYGMGGNCPGYGYGNGMGRGQGMGFGPGANPNCPGYNQQQNAVKPVTKDEATKKVQDYIAQNLKGYKIDKTQEFQGPRFTMYNFVVKDAAGNTFNLRVNPWGNVMGPFLAQQ